jgi:DNA-binding NtrC family response regulator
MKTKILVIDDEEVILEVMQRILQRNGYEVYVCATAVEALEFSGEHLPNLIISDYNLSELSNGVDLALSIRRLTKKEIPVIIMSGSRHYRHDARTNEFEFIKKPLDRMKLTALVESQLLETKSTSTESLREGLW